MKTDLATLKGMSKGHIQTFFSRTMYSLWNTYGRGMVDPHMWLLHYLGCQLDERGTNPHLKTMVKLFCKVCKEELGFQRPLTRGERRWLSNTLKRQVTKWSCKLHGTASSP
jgi:hypothetical protein